VLGGGQDLKDENQAKSHDQRRAMAHDRSPSGKESGLAMVDFVSGAGCPSEDCIHMDPTWGHWVG